MVDPGHLILIDPGGTPGPGRMVALLDVFREPAGPRSLHPTSYPHNGGASPRVGRLQLSTEGTTAMTGS